ncbi:YqiA/YcfP family alpha/beta fold hydrolase [Thiomicrospira sp. WB1]|uniref:YqiA/YcfP family alpha/beta fold hydrolase n=1 Tax=Thiomicrospira sp. WB1 TaxID=1685380 RepID=UPI0007485C14|nr:YqiA/YcfP family alpha/beta fold hydrolase [Thiomicrospira sp. WB1]KUJ72070.1 hypothetical protein AVO41_06435 [Thiomicrospira sp. WB1]
MILYLHGFLSSGESAKGRWFDARVTRCLSEAFARPTWPQSAPEKSARYLCRVLESAQASSEPIRAIMGSSLGGYWARWLGARYGLPSIWINPALALDAVFEPYYGEYIHPHTGETIRINTDYLRSLKQYEVSPSEVAPSLILLDGGDEVIDSAQTRVVYEPFEQVSIAWFDGGSHAFEHCEQAWPAVRAFLKTQDVVTQSFC